MSTEAAKPNRFRMQQRPLPRLRESPVVVRHIRDDPELAELLERKLGWTFEGEQ